MGQNPFEESFITEGISWQSENPLTVHLAGSICVLADGDDVAFNVISTNIIVTEAAHWFDVVDAGCDGLWNEWGLENSYFKSAVAKWLNWFNYFPFVELHHSINSAYC